MHASAGRLYEAVSRQLGGHKQADLARLLQETSQQIHAWERRGVSERGALKAQEQLGINATWILYGRGAMFLVQPQPWSEPGHAVGRVRDALRLASAATSEELQAVIGLPHESVAAGAMALMKSGEALLAAEDAPRWVVPRSVPEITSTGTVPVFQVDARGRPHEFGTLVPTTHGRYWMEERAGTNELHDGLPWFIQDMRPQGFLGRAFAMANPNLQLPLRPQLWTDDQVLRALALAGEDLPGNLIVGDRSFERFVRRSTPAHAARDDYPALAVAAMQGAAPGSSAGGEQPKFCCTREDGVHVLVKFSPPQDTPPGQRWADLLICESLALEQLIEAGIPAARSRIHQAGGRTFFEAERFDRTANGRRGMVSLLAYDSQYVGQIDNWAATAGRMQRQGLLTPLDAQRLRFLEMFGTAIANTDRHYGNVSLLIDATGDWTLAPAYDQLPMHYAPVAGEIVERPLQTRYEPTANTLPIWMPALLAAVRFWEAVAAHEAISPEFRKLAAHAHLDRLLPLTSEARQSSSHPPG